jgi:hypothetical protein
MMHIDALELQNRWRGERALVVVVAKKRSAASERAVACFAQAAEQEEIEAVSFDADEPTHAQLLEDLRVRMLPEIFVVRRGVVLERIHRARDAEDARVLLRQALRRHA